MVTGEVRTLLRLEGLAVFIVTTALFRYEHGSWWFYTWLSLAPDVAALGYVFGKRFGAHCYNIAHFYALPLTLYLYGYAHHHLVARQIAFVWAAHIGFDRALALGFKYPTAFKTTHLSKPVQAG